MLDITLFDNLAAILTYPAEDLIVHVEALCNDDRLTPEEREQFHVFSVYVRLVRPVEVEELFTQTFDLNPACCLEVGWQLYGEEYERGAFLVHMREALREEQIFETVELPDHLSHCLRLLSRLDPGDAIAFTQKYLHPAIGKIQDALTQDNPYAGVVSALKTTLDRRYGAARSDEPAQTKFIELPVLNNTLRYHNTEDAIDDPIRPPRPSLAHFNLR